MVGRSNATNSQFVRPEGANKLVNETVNGLTFKVKLKSKNQEVNMCRTISFKVSSGMDSAVRVLTTLRRKQFDVKGFSMETIDANNSEFRVMLEDEKKQGFDRAMLHMKKFVDVYDVCEYTNN